jgi:glutamine amidotransferase
MKRFRLAIINTGAANIHSVEKAVRVVGGDPVVTTSAAVLSSAHAAILPGVGANDAVMSKLNEWALTDPIKEYAASGRPLLCVCLGMQILYERSEEGELPGLGVLRGEVVRLPVMRSELNGHYLKIPHMGWNTVRFRNDAVPRHPIFRSVAQDSYFYFVHSYHCNSRDAEDVAATSPHGIDVCAAVVRENIVGTQFHPEKSGRSGLEIYANFLDFAKRVM